MLVAPLVWWLVTRRQSARITSAQVPWAPFALVMLPFLIDVTGNSIDLYDSVVWWDDLNHLVNWFFLCAGLGLLVCSRVSPRWAVLLLVTGLGALLAIGWELGEWYAFIRPGPELDTTRVGGEPAGEHDPQSGARGDPARRGGEAGRSLALSVGQHPLEAADQLRWLSETGLPDIDRGHGS